MEVKQRIVDEYINYSIQKKTTKITVREFCKYIQISRTTFYKYFKDCYEIIEYIFDQEAIKPMDILFKSDIDRVSLIESWYLSFYKHKEFYILAMKEDGQNSLFFTIVNKLAEYNKELYKTKFYGEDLEYLSYKYAAVQAMLMKKWLTDGMIVSHKKMAEYFLDNMFDGHN